MKPLSISQILSASSKMLENAAELIEEAEILLEKNRFPRAFTLAHLAIEELIKFNLLVPVAVALARGQKVNRKDIDIRLRDHRRKIGGAIFIDFLRQPGRDGAYNMNELSEQLKTIAKRNDLKNFSLYTSPIGQEFFKPSEVIDEQTAKACISRAGELFLLYQAFYVSIAMLTGMTEEGFQRFIEMPLLKDLFQELGSLTDLSDFSSITKV